MKKYLMVLFMVLSAYSLKAQIGFGIPVNFASLNGVVYNPGTHDLHQDTMWVTDGTNDELSSSEIANFNWMIEECHPGHIILGDATATYNCHGYTFGIVQGTDTCNISWCADLCYNAFEIVTTPRPGDIAVMRYNSGDFDSPHSGIVVNQDTLISKWGKLPLTKHHKDSVIFITAYETGQAHYTYYRRIINTPNNISGPFVFNGSGTFIFYPSYLNLTSCSWSVEPAEMFQVSSGTGDIANLSYKTPFVYLAPKATITFTFSYGCDNHYTVSKEFDLRIPTTTVSGNASDLDYIYNKAKNL